MRCREDRRGEEGRRAGPAGMYIWKRRRGSCKQESKLGMDGGRRVKWAQEEDDEGELKGGPGPPRDTAGYKGGALPVPAVCASCAAAGAIGTEETRRRRRRRRRSRGRIRVMVDLCRLPSTRIATFTYPTFSLPFLLQLQCV